MGVQAESEYLQPFIFLHLSNLSKSGFFFRCEIEDSGALSDLELYRRMGGWKSVGASQWFWTAAATGERMKRECY